MPFASKLRIWNTVCFAKFKFNVHRRVSSDLEVIKVVAERTRGTELLQELFIALRLTCVTDAMSALSMLLVGRYLPLKALT